MARGWESKNVEEQQAEQVGQAPVPSVAGEAAARERERQGLLLQRERILSERTGNPGRRAALLAALEDVEAALARLA